MTKGQKKAVYDVDFKDKCVKLVLGGMPAVEVAKTQHIPSVSTLYGWLAKRKKPKHKRSEEEKIMDAQDRMIANSTKQPKQPKDTSLKAVENYLSHARDAINKDLRTGVVKKLSRAHLLTLLAFNELTGE
jgi:transposase-like protein